jgi:hypothetical protein
MTLVDLSKAYEDARSRARRAEAELRELRDLLAMALCRSDAAAMQWLWELAQQRHESQVRDALDALAWARVRARAADVRHGRITSPGV